ncbi:hypothetical protein WR25_19686 [Diploscapter pachys]|uniref:TLC domain-containing protein n=1 Tax=Diploscapter pachys TaxID=2018661 RepID=A0A2A2JVY6_9BILA|nr:hypothetical protein WR25_19686 [Diploscapter pachys]
MIHHIVTIALLSTSWAINFVRVGTLVLVSHDVADIFLEGGKFIRYDLNNSTVTYILYGCFFSSWIITRLMYYPFVVIRSALFEAANLIQPDYDVWNFTQIPYVPRGIIMLLAALLLLHIFWTFIILKIFAKAISGKTPKDVRSDSESDFEDSDDRRKLVTKKREKKRVSDKSVDNDSEDEFESPTSRRRIPRKE